VQQLRRLVTGFSLQKPWFNPRVIHVGFVVDEMIMRRDFIRALEFSSANYHLTNAPYTHLSPWAAAIDEFKAAVQRYSVSQDSYNYFCIARQLIS
jgi:hypothetical protein